MKITLLITAIVCFACSNSSAQKTFSTPFQGTKEFCSFLKPVKFIVTISGSKAKIIHINSNQRDTTNGVFRNGKLYTDDMNEKTYDVQGKYYLITKTSLRINNLEGGDYNEFDLCK